MSAKPLDGLSVLDLGQIYNGAYCGMLLALAGAEVIKIEPPGGENLRRRGVVGGAAYPFVMLNSEKLGITLDLKHPRAKEVFLDMVGQADVVIENFTPGAMGRLGLGANVLRERNPRLIYASGSGFGSSGMYRNYAAMDLTVQALAGVMAITGYPDRPPVKAGPAICDFLAGIHLYGAIVTALYRRERTGLGDTVEVTMQESVFPSLMSALGLLLGGGDAASQRTGNRHSGLAESPYNVYPASDGYVAIICVNETHWERLVVLMDRPGLLADPRFGSLKDRVEHMDAVDEIVAAWTGEYGKAHLVEILQEGQVPCAEVKELQEVVDDENLWERRMLQYVDHPEMGRVIVPQSPLIFESAPRDLPRPSPSLGEHTKAVLGRFGVSEEEVDRLAADGAL